MEETPESHVDSIDPGDAMVEDGQGDPGDFASKLGSHRVSPCGLRSSPKRAKMAHFRLKKYGLSIAHSQESIN